jgi:hypothetical protein
MVSHSVSRSVIAAIVLALLAGCSSSRSPAAAPSHSPTPSPTAGKLITALGTYASSPCTLLDQDDLTALDIVDPPRQLSDTWGPSCYWIGPHQLLMGFLPYPSEKSRASIAAKPNTSHITIDGYQVTQTLESGDTCYQNVVLSQHDYFSTLIIRGSDEAQRNTCQIASAFTKLTLAHLEQ